MSTPRKHWFRVADSVSHEPWSNDVAAAFMRLGAHLNTRWARDGRSAADACRDRLSVGVAMSITGARSFQAAVERLAELASHVSIEIEVHGRMPLVYFVRRNDGLIKIGHTGNWPSRRTQLERQHGSIEVLGAIVQVDGSKLEKRLHRELSAHRVEGEWFRDVPAVRAWVARGTSTESEMVARSTYRGLPAVSVFWPKWSEFQGLTSRDQPNKSPGDSLGLPPPQSAPARRIEEEETPASAGAAPREESATEPPADQAPDPVPSFPPEVVRFAEDFRSAVLAANPGREPPNAAAFRGWCKDSRTLLGRRGPTEPVDLARWLFSGTGSNADFWRGVVFCPAKFREKYDALKKARERDERPALRAQGGGRIGPLEAIARIRARREAARQQDG